MLENRIKKFYSLALLFSIYLIYRFILPFNKENISIEINQIKYCFYDRWIMDYSKNLNFYSSQNLYFRDLMLILSSNSLDVLMISYLFFFIKYGDGKHTFLTLILFYGFRGILQKFFLFSFYPVYLFDHPGFFSISVPFDRAADFFYSGHSGCALILSLSFKKVGDKIFYYYGIFVTIIQVIVMTSITRAHYSIDVIFGLIIAHYFFILVDRILNKKKFS